MNKKKAIVLYSHNTHSFIVSELKYAAKNFEYVLLLCPRNQEIIDEAEKYSNVEVKTIIHGKSVSSFVRGCCITRNISQKELESSLSSKIISKNYIKLFFLYMTHTAILEGAMKDVLKKYSENEIVLLSFWFSATSFAAAEMKKRYPGITAISFAHSFEVDEIKNKYVKYLFKNEIHDLLDGIYFISSKVKDTYISKFALPNGWNVNKTHVTYLGVEKKHSGLSEASKKPPFRIVSCSHCVPVKRIDLIAKALCSIEEMEIEWVHIGDGPTRSIAELIVSDFPKNIRALFLGKKTNDYVHRYLADNSIDAFINVSSSEGLPVTLMEAMAYGIPIIATDVGGTSELYVKDIGILLCADPTEYEVREAICSLLNSSVTEMKMLRENARKCYLSWFDATIIRDDFYGSISQYE